MILIVNKRRNLTTILKKYSEAILADLTCGAKDGLVKLSPFYPHGGIPVPFSDGYTATCVEAIWQVLKVFEGADVDVQMFQNDTLNEFKLLLPEYDYLLKEVLQDFVLVTIRIGKTMYDIHRHPNIYFRLLRQPLDCFVLIRREANNYTKKWSTNTKSRRTLKEKDGSKI